MFFFHLRSYSVNIDESNSEFVSTFLLQYIKGHHCVLQIVLFFFTAWKNRVGTSFYNIILTLFFYYRA